MEKKRGRVPKGFTKEEQENMIRLREQGLSYQDIAGIVHSSDIRVTQYFKSIGDKPRKKSTKPLTEEETSVVIYLYTECRMSMSKIRDEIGISEMRIRKCLKENNIKMMSTRDGVDRAVEMREAIDPRSFADFERDEFIKELNRKK